MPENATVRPDVKTLRRGLMLLLTLLGLLLILLPSPSGLSPAGMKCLGVATICVSLWIFTPIPLAATSLIAIILLPALEILDRTLVFSFFGNSAVFSS